MEIKNIMLSIYSVVDNLNYSNFMMNIAMMMNCIDRNLI